MAADTKNSAPFLNDITVPTAVGGTPVNIQLTSQDVEGDPVYYDATVPSGSQYTVSVDHATGLVTLTPNSGFTGSMTATVGVRAATTADTVDTFDTQSITVTAAPTAPTGIDLTNASDTGSSDTDNTTNAGSLSFVVSGTVSGALVELRINGSVVGSATATGTSTTITTNNIAALGSGTYSISARQTLSSQTSSDSAALQLIYDNTQPVALASGAIPSTGNVGTPISVDLSHAEEGSGLVYAIQNGPTGMTINAATGLLQWTPGSTQTGAETFDVILTDKAGNSRTQSFTTTIGAQATGRISLSLVDLNGNPLTSASVGQSFKVQVFVKDLRPTENGVFAAFLDLLYDSNIVEVTGTSPITRGTNYTIAVTGDTNTLGVINELGGVSNSNAPLGEGPKLLAEVTMRTKAVGQAAFTAEPADGNGTQFLLYGSNDPVPNAQVNFGTASLAVGLNFTVGNDSFSVNEDAAVTSLDALLNDAVNQGSGAILTIQSVSTGSAGGTITIPSGGKSISYRPAANFNGTETFTYVVGNQDGATQTATVTVTVQPVNDAPVAVNDQVEFTQDTTGNVIVVLNNDTSGPDGTETLRVTSIGTPSAGGTATITSSGNTITYAPKAGFVGTETLSYTISDPGGLTSTATISIVVKPSVPPPTANVDSFTIAEDSTAADFDVLLNDTPSQTGETLSISAATATNGVVSVTSDSKKINYRPNANFVGTDVVSYTLRGSLGGSTVGRATFTVTSVNDAPNAVNDSLTANSTAATTTLDVLANDTNVDTGETLTISSVVQPSTGNGTVSISSDKKSIVYTPPNSNFSGTVSFSYTIGDGSALTSTATVSLNVSSFTLRQISGDLVTLSAGNLDFYTQLSLQGTTFDNTPVTRNIELSDSSFVIPNLVPGSYRIETPTLPFLTSQPESLVVNSSATDGDSVGNKLQVGAVSPVYFDMRDYMGSAVGHSLTVAVAPGKSQAWAAGAGDWKDFKKLTATLSANEKQLTIVGTKNNNQVVQATVNVENPGKVDLRGSDVEARLFKLRMRPSDITFTPTTTSNSNASGEGEGAGVVGVPSTRVPAAPSTGMAEGEGEGVPTISSSVSSNTISSSGNSITARDEAFRQVSPNLRLISEAGDRLASDLGVDDDDTKESTDVVFESIDEMLDVDFKVLGT